MTLYSAVLFVHSWLRWIILLLGVTAIVRGRRNDPVASAWMGLLDLQIVIGITLYGWLSPITQAAFADFKGAMHDAVPRFWGVEHAFAMLLAAFVAHAGRIIAKRTQDDERAAAIMRITIVLALLCIVVGVPWSPLKYGRPLFRF